MEYKTKGVCSMAIQYDIDDEQKVHNVKFIGGCSGNTQGVAKLVEGMPAKEVIARLEGIQCGRRPTSCPDQLATALKKRFHNYFPGIFVPGISFQTVTLTHQFCPIYRIKIGHPLKTSPDLCLHSPRFCV